MATSVKGNSESSSGVHYEHHVEGYSELSAQQQNIIQAFLPHIKQALGEIVNSTQTKSSLVVVDYGAADGINSIPIIAACNDVITDKINAISWIFNDACTTKKDLTPFIEEELAKRHRSDSFQRFTFQYKKGNFYDKVTTKASVDLGISLNAIHWLSQRPVTTNNIRALSTDPATRSIGARDWLNFLNARATELKPGGRMVLHVNIEDEAEEQKEGSVTITAVIGEAYVDLYKDGTITKEDIKFASVLPVCSRRIADIIAPFNDDKSGLDKSIKLLSYQTQLVEDPFYRTWYKNGGPTDEAATEAYIMSQVNFVKSFANTFWQFTKERTTEEEYRFILDKFYEAVERIIRIKPGAYHCSDTVAIVDIVKL